MMLAISKRSRKKGKPWNFESEGNEFKQDCLKRRKKE
jgi:hypothetical protein